MCGCQIHTAGREGLSRCEHNRRAGHHMRVRRHMRQPKHRLEKRRAEENPAADYDDNPNGSLKACPGGRNCRLNTHTICQEISLESHCDGGGGALTADATALRRAPAQTEAFSETVAITGSAAAPAAPAAAAAAAAAALLSAASSGMASTAVSGWKNEKLPVSPLGYHCIHHFSAKFIIINSKFIIYTTKFITHTINHTQSLRDVPGNQAVMEIACALSHDQLQAELPRERSAAQSAGAGRED